MEPKPISKKLEGTNSEREEAIESLKQLQEKIIQEARGLSREEILQCRDEGRK